MNNKNLRSKVKGSLYGFAIGDAMGATTEFMQAHQIKKQFGAVKDIIGGGWLGLKSGECTDDTQMMLCVIEAIKRYPNDLKNFEKECGNNFIDWIKSNPKDIGSQCYKGITSLMNGYKIGYDDHAIGNGSLMRALPCALLAAVDILSLDDAIKFNIAQGSLTHNNSLCNDIIENYTCRIAFAIKDRKEDYSLFTGKVDPNGDVLSTYRNVLYWLDKDSLKDAIEGAVNDGGDSDTIAAITGGLVGAKFGYDSIHKKWINELNEDIKTSLNNFENFLFSYVQTQSNVI